MTRAHKSINRFHAENHIPGLEDQHRLSSSPAYSYSSQSTNAGFENLDVESIGRLVSHDGDYYSGFFKHFRVKSAFQPIYSLAHKRIIGYEALARAMDSDKQTVNPAQLFSLEKKESDIIFLDRLCRYVHINNFGGLEDHINWLFLNVAPQTIMNGKFYGSFFGDLLKKFNFSPHRVVIEIVEHPIAKKDNERLQETVEYYKELGNLIAIDDFGAGHSNFDRIWMLQPHIVKLDRSMLVKASTEKNIRRMLQGIVSLLHQGGALVLIEGVETEEQAMIVMESDADFVQGYFFSRPSENLDQIRSTRVPFDKLFDSYKTLSTFRGRESMQIYNRYYKIFNDAIQRIKEDHSLVGACDGLFREASAVRCYQLMPNGIQVGHTVVSESYSENADLRFKPLEDARSADWFRRHYLIRAIMHPDQLQITRPYLSITGAHMCITLSMMFSTESGDRVLCCDLNIE